METYYARQSKLLNKIKMIKGLTFVSSILTFQFRAVLERRSTANEQLRDCGILPGNRFFHVPNKNKIKKEEEDEETYLT